MADFPTLSVYPSIHGWAEEVAVDPTIRNDYEAGYVITRARFTRIPKKWHVVYNAMPQSDKEILQAFENDVKVGSCAFNWTNPLDNIQYTVRFLAPISYRLLSPGIWQVEFDLEEV